MKSSDILKAAKETLSDPKRWTKGEIARNANGKKCNASDPEATCWCIVGSVIRARHLMMSEGKDFDKWSLTCLWKTVPEDIMMKTGATVLYHDAEERTHEEVMAWLDRAISMAEAEEAKAA